MQPTFLPWEGPNYRSSRPRLLVVGESQYDWATRKVSDKLSTRRIVRDVIAYPKLGGVFQKFSAAILGHWPDFKERQNLLRRIAFYNYIQCWMGAPRERVSAAMWATGEGPFPVVLTLLQPQLILVFGKRTWNRLPNLDGAKGKPLTTSDGDHNSTWLYPGGRRQPALAFHIPHPSGGRFNFKQFSGLFKEAKVRVLNNKL